MAIRSDNGVPFPSPNTLLNLSKLSVWSLRLGIQIEASSRAIRNRMDAMSACISLSRTRPPAGPAPSSLQQLNKFNNFVHEFNRERPHEALGMKCPADVCIPSLRAIEIIRLYGSNTVSNSPWV